MPGFFGAFFSFRALGYEELHAQGQCLAQYTVNLTPPFGFALFYIKGIVPPEVKIQEIYRGVIPFILIIIAVVVLVTFFPQVVYFLPNLVAS